jgi:hypothetical protein
VRAGVLFVSGVWIGLLVASWAMASASFRTADRLLGPDARPEMQARLAAFAPDDRRVVLRHAAAEANRWMFRSWGAMEMALAAGLVALSWRLGTGLRWTALGVAAVVVLQVGAVGPAIAQLGRSLDFVPRPLPAAAARQFGLLHAAYMLADVAKAAGLAAAAFIARRGL